ADQVMQMEEMYNPSNDMIGRDSSRRSDTDIAMFGFYIYNNVGIDFRIYGMGIFAGIGTLISLLYNGLVIGGVGGHLTGIGFGETFWTFVSGHGSFELTAAVISGAAGLRLAQSLFMPGNYRRLDAFKIAGKQSIELLIGAATMTFIAAFIEAFWSSASLIPDMVKYGVAALLWLAVISYLCLAGRREQALSHLHQSTAIPTSQARNASTVSIAPNAINTPNALANPSKGKL
ncbi:MAG: stage II sporulation protein M, partial [Psychrobacter sp.]|nr:stage II sporulation protein M [Psychrobacter sp.]